MLAILYWTFASISHKSKKSFTIEFQTDTENEYLMLSFFMLFDYECTHFEIGKKISQSKYKKIQFSAFDPFFFIDILTYIFFEMMSFFKC